MRTMISWLIGFSLGAALGAALIMLFSPVSGQDLTSAVKNHYRNALDAGHAASEAKRTELEDQLRKMRAARGLNPKAE
ncbi:MAG: YtxH domain-containing protein [Anaerolineae bacterium]